MTDRTRPDTAPQYAQLDAALLDEWAKVRTEQTPRRLLLLAEALQRALQAGDR